MKSRTLPKGTNIAYAKSNPLAMLAPDDEMAQSVGAALDVTEQTPATGGYVQPRKDSSSISPSTEDVKCKRSPNEGSTTASDCRTEINLSHIECTQLRTRFLDILALHGSMWDRRQGTVCATEHRIDPDETARPICSMPYRQGQARCAIFKAEV